jgi:hypothetical protein
MTSLQYSRLAPDLGSADIPLSPFPSASGLKNAPILQDAILSQDRLPQKRGFFGAVKGWWLELGSVVLAIAIMLCTIVLLAYYNGKPISETPRRPSLNTLVNIFSTIEAGLIVFVAAEGLHPIYQDV